MDKAKKLNIEEALCEYLAKNFRGANNPVSSKTLETVFHVKGSEIRRMVNSLRCKGEPICSDLDGACKAEVPRSQLDVPGHRSFADVPSDG